MTGDDLLCYTFCMKKLLMVLALGLMFVSESVSANITCVKEDRPLTESYNAYKNIGILEVLESSVQREDARKNISYDTKVRVVKSIKGFTSYSTIMIHSPSFYTLPRYWEVGDKIPVVTNREIKEGVITLTDVCSYRDYSNYTLEDIEALEISMWDKVKYPLFAGLLLVALGIVFFVRRKKLGVFKSK